MLTRRVVPATDGGFTLAEVVVGMSLLLTVMTLSMNFFISAGQTASRITGQSLTAASGRTTLDQISTMLRYADTPTQQAGYATSRFTHVASNEITFFSNIAGNSRTGTAGRQPPTKVDITASGTTLTETIYVPQMVSAQPSSGEYYPYSAGYTSTGSAPFWAVYPSTPTNTVVWLSTLGNASSVFTYCTADTDPAVTCTPTSDPTTVAAVGVYLVVNGKPGEAPQTLQTTIAITGSLS